eukprot:14196874-Alexandrium_andersonii.AAC.1
MQMARLRWRGGGQRDPWCPGPPTGRPLLAAGSLGRSRPPAPGHRRADRRPGPPGLLPGRPLRPDGGRGDPPG